METLLRIVIGLVVLCVPASIVASWVMNNRELARKRSRDFAWFQKNHPEHVHRNRVTCPACGSGNIGTERLMGGSFLRRHFCRRCGTNLYYSPEE